jgi:elongation factor 3
MPHLEMASADVSLPIRSAGDATAPSKAEITQLLHTIFNADKAQTSLDASYALTDILLKTVSFRGFKQYGIFDEIRKAATNKKSVGNREGAMFALGALVERFPPAVPLSEVIFMVQEGNLVNLALDGLADKVPATRESAQYALDELFRHLKVEGLAFGLLPTLITYLQKSTSKWLGTVGALVLLGRMADKSKVGTGTAEEEAEKDVLRNAMGRRLNGLIPVVEGGMHDLKTEVSKQAIKTMNSLTTLLQNDDVAPRIPQLIKAMEKPSPETLQKAILVLSQTTFVAEVDSPVLALLTPLLERSLNTPTTSQEVIRQTVVVTENLTKLVHDPLEARAFLPKLQPGVTRVRDGASMPEVRELAQRTLTVMEQAMSGQGGRKGLIERVTSADVTQKLDAAVAKHAKLSTYAGDVEIWNATRSYIGEIVSDLVNQRHIDRITGSIAPYVAPLLKTGNVDAIAEDVRAYFAAEDERKFGVPVKDDDDEVEIVNANFSLGYGGMLLLSHTNLKLLKGHRYGLCGRNGAGKSTLMRSIADGKLEGFPSPDEVRTCFVEHNQGEDAEISILEYCFKDPKLAPEGKERISQVLEEVGFSAGEGGRQFEPVGSLSGGWKMKLALARAMLMRADVLLLDEPTNHLDVANIAWLKTYLKTHTEITSLIVSHDSTFLDDVCTDIYHYESKKLVCYKGNLADFVKVKPEAKSYYTLTASQVQFKFPPPGILTGVKSHTRAILRMTNSTYTYPGSSKPSLTDVSCHLSLSSRVAILGANGAGKSTLVKVLTGEVIPQEGKVEKHPNLRIGYIKQHALEHVEMHTEKTPNQYLQWRYANGDDREVLMKQTRVLTPEDQAQMDVSIDLQDGKGPRQIEALLGRQKWKKSFQYEV